MAYPNYYNGGYFPQYQNGAIPDMLNQYKGQYQQPIMQQPIVQQTPTPTNDILWVLNENEATSYPVAPNNSVVLWDKNNKTFYIKTANAQGVPSMQIYDFTERVENSSKTRAEHVCKCGDKFATKEQLNALEGKIEDILAMYDELKEKQTTKTTKKAKESEE